jgi:beta-glucanase (GH16 family)
MPSLIDADTVSSAYTRKGTDGRNYNLVFSDEFNNPGRTFWPGDDPYWEAVDLQYWATGDLEWYNPQVRYISGQVLNCIDILLSQRLSQQKMANWSSPSQKCRTMI